MATLASRLHIPREVVSLILENIEEAQFLSKASLLSRTWYQYAFPYLHRDMLVEHIPHLEILTTRLEAETPNHSLRIGLCLRSLLFSIADDELAADPNLQALHRFESVIRKLEGLRQLEWMGTFVPQYSIIGSFRDTPKLHTLYVHTLTDETITEDFNKKVFVLKNLANIDIGWRITRRGHPSKVSDTIIEMIENSPDLIELSLDIATVRSAWRPAKLFDSLRNPLPRLTKLSIGGDIELDWNKLLGDSPQGFKMRSFLEQHSDLRGVHFMCDFQYQPDTAFNPDTMERIFPSLTSFTGSITMCIAVITSRLAGRLESLGIVHEEGANAQLIGALVNVIKPLSKLKALKFVDRGTIDSSDPSRVLDINTLNKLLTATPGVAVLALDYFHLELGHILQSLHRVPLLTELNVHRGPHSLDPIELDNRDAAQALEVCPRLRIMRITSDSDGLRLLKFRRWSNDSISLVIAC